MSNYPPRCPHCAASIDVSVGVMERLRFWSEHTVHCPTCSRPCTSRDAQVMGDAYGRWAEQLTGQIKAFADALPIIQQVEARRLMGTNVHDENVRLMTSPDTLVRACLRPGRSVLIEQSHGQEASVELVQLSDPQNASIAIGVLLGQPSKTSRRSEWELFFARITSNQFAVYVPPADAPIEQRVRDAKRARDLKAHSHHASQPHRSAAHA